MKLAIINQHFHIGGVETFLLSLTRHLMRRGCEVYVFLIEPSNVDHELIAQLQVQGVRVTSFDELRHYEHGRRFDVALVTNPQTLFETLRRFHLGSLQVDRLVVGAYQTRMYCLKRGPLNLHNKLTRLMLARLPASNVIYCNNACRNEHAKEVPTMADAPIIPLIVDGDKFQRRKPRDVATPKSIISIGRLDYFKTYNITMLEVIRRLRDQGHRISWEVYGSGVLQTEMYRRIVDLDLRDCVTLHGDINYGSIPHILSNAFAFVGSGLSMMEAAASGVPTLPAVEYTDRPLTYGFPHEIPGNSFFEPGLPLKSYDLTERIADLIGATAKQYEEIADAGREKMSYFFAHKVAEQYLQTFEAASEVWPDLGGVAYRVFTASRRLHHDGSRFLKRLGLRVA